MPPRRWRLWTGLLVSCLFWLAACQSNDASAVPAGATNDQLALGAEVYAANCASCHGADLEGEENWKVANDDGTWRAPPHDESGHTWHHPDSYILSRIRNGTSDLDPSMQDASNMPAYADILNDAEIDAVLAFIKSQWPADIQKVQAANN